MVSHEYMSVVEQVESLADVDPAEWDRLGEGRVLASYGWWRTFETTRLSQSPLRYFLVRTADGLVGAACCEIQDRRPGVAGIDALLFGRLVGAARLLRLSVSPSLVCGVAPIAARAPLLVRGDLPAGERRQVTTDLVHAIETEARTHGRTVCVRGVRREPSAIAGVLAERGYLRSAELPAACLELNPDWHSFDDYRRELKKTHENTEKGIRREMNRGRRAGLVIERLAPPLTCSGRLHALLTSHYLRLNGRPFPYGPGFLDQLTSRLGDRALIYAARIGEELVGVLVAVQDDEDVAIPMIGIDDDAGRKGAAYFNLGYNRPIADAIASGRRRLYLGTLVYDLKGRRGAVRVDSDFHLRVWSSTHAIALRAVLGLRDERVARMSAALSRSEMAHT